MDIKQSKKRAFLLITLSALILMTFTLIFIVGKEIKKINDKDLEISKNRRYFENVSNIDKGKSIGRNAALIYISRHHKEWKSDTVSIEIIELLNIEDSLSSIKDSTNAK